MKLLSVPSNLTVPVISAEIMKVWAERDQRDPEPALGPSREEMMDRLKLTNVS